MDVDEAIAHVWNYHHLNQIPGPSGMIWALGSHDLRVADRVAELWHQGLAPLIVMSGGFGNFTDGLFAKPEAELFAERAEAAGVPTDAILLEARSSNCGENVQFTRELLRKHNLDIRSAIAVQKPYMERRTFATIRKQWPELDVRVTSPQLSFEAYCNTEFPTERIIHIMIGDLQRIMEYPRRGFMISQEVPDIVRQAFELLVESGFDQHLLK